MNERWKPVPMYEGLYEVSDLGRVRSVDRVVRMDTVTQRTKQLKSVMIKPQSYTNGYLFVCLSKDGKKKQYALHRIVATVFLPNPDKKEEVNHINEDKTDNRLCNLQWTTVAENRNYGTRLKRAVAHRDQTGIRNGMFGRKGNLNPRSVRVFQFDLNGNFIQKFDSINEAAEKTGSNPSSISKAAKGIIRQTNGFKWEFDHQLIN